MLPLLLYQEPELQCLKQPWDFALCMQHTSATGLFWDSHIPKQTPVYREVEKIGKLGYHLD